MRAALCGAFSYRRTKYFFQCTMKLSLLSMVFMQKGLSLVLIFRYNKKKACQYIRGKGLGGKALVCAMRKVDTSACRKG